MIKGTIIHEAPNDRITQLTNSLVEIRNLKDISSEHITKLTAKNDAALRVKAQETILLAIIEEARRSFPIIEQVIQQSEP